VSFDPDSPQARSEFLEADGIGGYASGPVAGPRTRRYHALLLTAVDPPARRLVLVNGIEAWLEQGATTLPLTTQRYRPDVLSPATTAPIADFTPTPWPRWTYTLPDATTLDFELFVAPDACETILRFHAPPACPWRLHIRPLLSGRDQGDLHHENPAFRFAPTITGGNVTWRPYDSVPAIAALTNGAYTHAPQWYRQFLYTKERDRGLDDTEDLASPGFFTFDLAQSPAVLILRAGDGLALRPAAHAESLATLERARRAATPGIEGAAATYLVDRATRSHTAGRTIIAGFPWFADWGRDSFIALRGLTLATGRLPEARAILLAWSGLVSEGMLPNRFPDDGGAAEYNAVDASLWFIIAANDYLAAAPTDAEAATALTTAATKILTGYRDGTRYNIHMDTDALIAAGQPGIQLTWMDAKVDDWVVTPRIGKPVEVQALWINALRIAAAWTPQSPWADLAARAQTSFRARFPNPAGGLFDVIDSDHIPGQTDASLRPNQIFAIGGLPHQILAGPQARAVVDLVEHHLLTPLGLRTLAPNDPAYRPRYQGDRVSRDGAYHQGTAWPWLLGPFIEAWLRVRDNTEAARAEAAARFLPPLEAHLAVDGIGHICEVADGDAPHTPGGCPWQAWSLGELIRVRRMLETSE
jgi:predicted glycogen debranching enzyme